MNESSADVMIVSNVKKFKMTKSALQLLREMYWMNEVLVSNSERKHNFKSSLGALHPGKALLHQIPPCDKGI